MIGFAVSEFRPVGKRIFERADFYLSRGDRKRLGRLLLRHPYLLASQNSMLVYRAVWQYRGMLRWLLSHGVHPDCKMSPTDGTPLMHAAAEGDVESIRLLLEYSADPNARNERNESPLGYALSYGHLEAAKLLVQRGADVNGIEYEGKTHLDWETICGREQAAQVIRSLGGLPYAELDRNHGGSS